MVFSSPAFLFIFFPLFFLAYFAVPRAARNALILAASVVFYLLGAGALTLLALVLVLANWLLGLALDRLPRAGGRAHHLRKLMTAGGLLLNLAPLVFFKYLVFLLHLLSDVSGVRLLPGYDGAGWVLPLGISFYTFHFISYVLDVRAGRIRAERSLAKFALYIFLFPHLVAGPVVRYAEIRAQLEPARRRLMGGAVFWGLALFVAGLAKKLLIADPLGGVTDTVFKNGAPLTVYSSWLAALCYAFQIYFDFSGYSDMAIGMARAMGFRFPRNFRRPYASASITAFWRRWHMTLSRWFRDYVYIPLGGNRVSAPATYRNLVVVFTLCGLWHGAAYTFLVWGLGHGLLLALERARVLRLERLPLAGVAVFALVTLLWVPFRAPDVGFATQVWSAMFGLHGTPGWLDANRMLADAKILFLLALAAAICLPPDGAARRLRRFGLRRPALMGALCLALYALAAVSVVERGFNPFIYFQF